MNVYRTRMRDTSLKRRRGTWVSTGQYT